MSAEKHAGSLPTIHHQNGRSRRKCTGLWMTVYSGRSDQEQDSRVPMRGLLRPCGTQKPEEPDDSAQSVGSSIRPGQTRSVFGPNLRTTKEENNHRCLFNSEQLWILLQDILRLVYLAHFLFLIWHYRIDEGATFMGVSMKHLSLVILLLQNSTLVLMMRYSRVNVQPDQPMYLASTAVFFAELIKLLACVFVLAYKTKSIARTSYILRKEIIEQPQEILKMLVPSGLYALQNNLLYVALSNLEAATFQVTYQMKILSTAVFSVVMLNKRLTRQKWFSLCLLMLGVTLVQLQNVGSPKASAPITIIDTKSEGESEILEESPVENIADAMADAMADEGSDGDDGPIQNPFIGLVAVLTSCVSSGFAGCYFEKILKGAEADMWVRNIQLGISGALFSFLAMFYDRQKIYDGGLLQGYSTMTWIVVCNQALGGLLVAIVVKYADNILKGFATSLSIIISGIISVYFFDFEPSLQFQLGTLVVIMSTYLYGRPDAPIPGFIRREKKRQSIPPPVKYSL